MLRHVFGLRQGCAGLQFHTGCDIPAFHHGEELYFNVTTNNEAERGALASQVCNMGRMAAHTGQRVMWDDALNADPLAPEIEKLVGLGGDSAPVKADTDGFYPTPQPGITKKREY